ncbi:hypothetical protein NDU88_000259 [Pleurodeles waltl]|uniref:Uncharacterized protein n=1 Tax=Pleurodeles waltl TaxID=8319 RepID=A0AAV7V8G1_PLEWA|nr:hypothetical protein NDU88_000259 [Pleurodeles waltl]
MWRPRARVVSSRAVHCEAVSVSVTIPPQSGAPRTGSWAPAPLLTQPLARAHRRGRSRLLGVRAPLPARTRHATAACRANRCSVGLPSLPRAPDVGPRATSVRPRAPRLTPTRSRRQFRPRRPGWPRPHGG